MNPYVYSKGRKDWPKTRASYSLGELAKAIFNLPLNSAISLAIVVFAAGSVAGVTTIAYSELSNGGFAPLAQIAATPRVLGAVTTASYGYNSPVCGYRTANCLNHSLSGFNGTGWQVRIDYQLEQGITGVIRVNGWPFLDDITGTGYGFTGYDLIPGKTYDFVLYKKLKSGKLSKLTDLDLLAPDAPSTPPPSQPYGYYQPSPYPATDSDNSQDYTNVSFGDGSGITPQKYPDLFVKGTTKGTYSGCQPDPYSQSCNQIFGGDPSNPTGSQPASDNFTTYYDNCANDNQLNEGYIRRDGLISSIGVPAPDGYICQNGAFVSISSLNIAPVFYVGPIIVDSVNCGARVTFAVNNYSGKQVWVTQYRNPLPAANGYLGTPIYDKIDTVPESYNLACNQDEGYYVTKVYSVVNGQKGALLGTTNFRVNSLSSSASATSSPVSLAFYQNGGQVTSAKCGTAITFQMTNYPGGQVWLTQYKNNASTPGYDQIDSLPDTYTLVCNKDEGYYLTYAYAVSNGQKGALLGSTGFTVTPASQASSIATSTNATYNFFNASNPFSTVFTAGKDSWRFILSNAQPGDTLTVTIYKDNVYKTTATVCTVAAGANSCVANGTPALGDVGNWNESVYIDGIPKGTVNFIVQAPQTTGSSTSTPSSSPTFSFTPNGGTLVAGKDSWNFSLTGASPGDTLSADIYKNQGYQGRADICSVSTAVTAIPQSSCSASGSPDATYIGSWTETVYINGVPKGTVSFNVVGTGSATIKQTASLTVNGQQSVTVNVGDTLNYVWNSTNADWNDAYYTVDQADACGNYPGSQIPWPANTASGTRTVTAQACQSGTTYTITFRANKTGVQPVTSSVTVKVGSASSGSSSATPAFYVAGIRTNIVPCGASFVFNIDNYSGSQVWLTQYKNGGSTPNYDGLLPVPLTYTTSCSNPSDLGTTVNQVYTVSNGQKGSYLGSATATVSPQSNPGSSSNPTSSSSSNSTSSSSGSSAITAMSIVGLDSASDSGNLDMSVGNGNFSFTASASTGEPTLHYHIDWGICPGLTVTDQVVNNGSALPVKGITFGNCSYGAIPGDYTITFTASSVANPSISKTITKIVHVSANPPRVGYMAVKGPASVTAGTAATFGFIASASANFPDANLSYKVDWGDGATSQDFGPNDSNAVVDANSVSTMKTFNHTYASAGGYTITFTATVPSNTSVSRSTTYNAVVSGSSQPAVSGTPTFYVAGIRTNIVPCGASFVFNIDGYSGSQVWLTQYKNGGSTPNYDGLLSVPLTYPTSCSNPSDLGTTVNQVYTVSNGQKGAYLGSATATVTPQAQATSYNPVFSFTPNGGTLVAGRDSWSFSLSGAKGGDTLTSNAYKNNVLVGSPSICTVATGATFCSATGTPQADSVGNWYEDVYLNGSYQGRISFSVTQ